LTDSSIYIFTNVYRHRVLTITNRNLHLIIVANFSVKCKFLFPFF